MLNKLKILKDKRGSVYIETMVAMLVVMFLLVASLEVFGIVVKYQDIHYAAKAITKVVEQEGALTSAAYDKLAALNDNFGINASLDITDVKYFDSRDKTIQFRDAFTIVITDSYDLTLLTPIAAPPVVINIPLHSTVTGMSEVYWK